MRARVIETGEIVNVIPNPTWYTEEGQGPDRRQWDEDELSFEFNTPKRFVNIDNLWKDAQGDGLPEIDREVIVLCQLHPLVGIFKRNEYLVSFAHRPPEYREGENIGTGKVTRYYPKRYDKGEWNIPDVKYWLDLDIPKMKEND